MVDDASWNGAPALFQDRKEEEEYDDDDDTYVYSSRLDSRLVVYAIIIFWSLLAIPKYIHINIKVSR